MNIHINVSAMFIRMLQLVVVGTLDDSSFPLNIYLSAKYLFFQLRPRLPGDMRDKLCKYQVSLIIII